jgi:hypothetical protein
MGNTQIAAAVCLLVACQTGKGVQNVEKEMMEVAHMIQGNQIGLSKETP